MNKHTPGPWKAEECALNFIDITHSQLNVPGAITHTLCRVQARQTWRGEATANARLIAAAPDLLDALRNYVDGCSSSVDASAVARAAINKATGSA